MRNFGLLDSLFLERTSCGGQIRGILVNKVQDKMIIKTRLAFPTD